MSSQDDLLSGPNKKLGAIEAEMERRFGTRYIDYRKKYDMAGKFLFEPDFEACRLLAEVNDTLKAVTPHFSYQ